MDSLVTVGSTNEFVGNSRPVLDGGIPGPISELFAPNFLRMFSGQQRADILQVSFRLPYAHIGQLFEASLRTEVAEARFTDLSGIADPSHLVDSHCSPIGEFEKCTLIGEIAIENAQRSVEDAIFVTVWNTYTTDAHDVRREHGEDAADRMGRVLHRWETRRRLPVVA